MSKTEAVQSEWLSRRDRKFEPKFIANRRKAHLTRVPKDFKSFVAVIGAVVHLSQSGETATIAWKFKSLIRSQQAGELGFGRC